MNCFECMSILPILIQRLIVWGAPCIFKHQTHYKSSLEGQLTSSRARRGGWWSGPAKDCIDTRETFFVFLGFVHRKKSTQELRQFVNRLAEDMNRKGQVPAKYIAHWWQGERPYYRSEIKKRPVVDSNMYFIILIWILHEADPGSIRELYLPTQRAFKWLEKHIAEDTFYEPIDSSWETTRAHQGHLLLTNVLMTKTIHSMELIALINNDSRMKDKCIKMHKKFVQKWQPELYRTQEVLPRILAVYWNIVPPAFLMSFNQELNTIFIPLRTEGPISLSTTFRAKIRGRDDMHTDIIWPFVGFLWIITLASRMKHEQANQWWANYMEFQAPRTLHNMYCPHTGKPIRRSFLRSEAKHAATLSLFLAAKHALETVEKEINEIMMPV